MQSRKRFLKDIVAVTLAFVMSLTIVLIVEKYLVHEMPENAGHEAVLFLEVAVVLVSIGSFMLRETLDTLERILNMLRGKADRSQKSAHGVFILLVALGTSASIYISVLRWAAGH